MSVPKPPRAVAARVASSVLDVKNQAPSDHAIAAVALSLLAVADAITAGTSLIARSQQEIASAIRETGR